jgi:hypothetical protein
MKFKTSNIIDPRCHPREGGDPEQKTPNHLKDWIPAFAGMTVERILQKNYKQKKARHS